jgi:cytochrome c peroxidase
MRSFCLATALLALTACSNGSGSGSTDSSAGAGTNLSTMAVLGDKIFHDPSLSASGRLACAGCHDPTHGFTTSAVVPLGGPGLADAGLRNSPSLTYAAFAPAFYFDKEGTPTGGFNRDGRANSLADQAARPFLTAFEMGNASTADVADKLSRTAYAKEFRALFGEQIFNDPEQAFARALLAIQAYEQEDKNEFAPFSSKYDYFLAGKTQLSAQELAGLALYNDPQKGNCAACHPSTRGTDGSPPMFTDFTYDNLGVPRNAAIAANADPNYFDLGLCGPQRTDLAQRTDLCGAFKVPSLRNVAVTAPYFHNGRFQTLREAISFYVRRDTNPEEWYPLDGNGLVRKFDDLPPEYVRNVNTTEVPYNRIPGDLPALTESEIDDVVAFLQTLTDGYQP